jgi:hypothetical protein
MANNHPDDDFETKYPVYTRKRPRDYSAAEVEALDNAIAAALAHVQGVDERLIYQDTEGIVLALLKNLNDGELYMLGVNLCFQLRRRASTLFNGLRAHSTRIDR